MNYFTYAGKVGQIVQPLEAMSDREALEKGAERGGVRIVVRVEADGKKVKIFEDWNHLLTPDHKIFTYLRE